MPRPLIVEVHFQIRAGYWERTLEEIASSLQADKSQYSLTPLYLTYDVEDTEIRACFQITDPHKLGLLIVNELRRIEGVHGTRVRLTLNGEIFPKGLGMLADDSRAYVSSHVFLKVDPSKDREVWESLRELKGCENVFPTWVFRDFYEYERDITLRLVGETKDEVRRYVEKYVEPINGIILWRLQFMRGMIRILAKERLLQLAQNWLAEKQAIA